VADYLQTVRQPVPTGHQHGSTATWKIEGGINTRKIKPGDTLWVVGALDAASMPVASGTPAWTLVARIEVEKIRPVPYQSHVIRPGPGSCWFQPADLTDVVAQLFRTVDDRDMPEPAPSSRRATPPAPSLVPPPPSPAPAHPLSPGERDAQRQRLLDAVSGLAGALRLQELAAVQPGTQERRYAGLPAVGGAQASLTRATPASPPRRAMADTLRLSLNDRHPAVSGLVDAEPLRRWADQLAPLEVVAGIQVTEQERCPATASKRPSAITRLTRLPANGAAPGPESPAPRKTLAEIAAANTAARRRYAVQEAAGEHGPPRPAHLPNQWAPPKPAKKTRR
jgi:hypothetical protein